MTDPLAVPDGITTKHYQPAIATDRFDWHAWRGDYEPLDRIGYGATEAQAVADLLAQEEADAEAVPEPVTCEPARNAEPSIEARGLCGHCHEQRVLVGHGAICGECADKLAEPPRAEGGHPKPNLELSELYTVAVAHGYKTPLEMLDAIGELRAALEPLVKLAGYYDESEFGSVVADALHVQVRLGDLRAARALLNKAQTALAKH